jgi:hypothetical protein
VDEKYTQLLKTEYVLSARWATREEIANFVSFNEENGHHEFNSLEGYAKVRLLPCGYLFEVEYLRYVPSKEVSHSYQLAHLD